MSAAEYDSDLDNVDDDPECWMCGGSGYLEDECTCGEDTCCCLVRTPPDCPECAIGPHIERLRRIRAARMEVLRSLDIAKATAWLKANGRWCDGITEELILASMHAERAASKEFTTTERADSACWVEGLL